MNYNNSIASNNETFNNGLNIHLVSFSLPKEIIKEKEQIRVSITAMPDGIKQHFNIKGKLMDYTNHLFSLNITNQTTKIVMVFRKKTILKDNPIIASTTIDLKNIKEMPTKQITKGMIDTEIKTVNLYYPLQKQQKEEHEKNVKRVILGNMKMILSFTPPFSSIENDKVKQNSKNNKYQKKRRSSSKVSDYNEISDSGDYEAPLL